MYNVRNEKLQGIITKEFITNDGHALNGCFETIDDAYTLIATDTLDRLVYDAKNKARSDGINAAIRGTYYANGEPVQGLYATEDANLIVAESDFIGKALSLQAELKRMSAVNSSLQAQIINNGKVLSDRYKASAKKEATEKYGDEIITEYLETHKAELIEQFRPEIEDVVIQEYLKTHKSKANWDKANQKRSENCAGRTAAYLADLYNGLDTKEIAEKHDAVRGTVQRLLKINDSSDVERLMETYISNKELFGDVTTQDMRSWLEARLNKKTESLEKRLAAARKLIAKNTDNWGD